MQFFLKYVNLFNVIGDKSWQAKINMNLYKNK